MTAAAAPPLLRLRVDASPAHHRVCAVLGVDGASDGPLKFW
jgi:hypothetical protein